MLGPQRRHPDEPYEKLNLAGLGSTINEIQQFSTSGHQAPRNGLDKSRNEELTNNYRNWLDQQPQK